MDGSKGERENGRGVTRLLIAVSLSWIQFSLNLPEPLKRNPCFIAIGFLSLSVMVNAADEYFIGYHQDVLSTDQLFLH
jgi:hypothetical protein